MFNILVEIYSLYNRVVLKTKLIMSLFTTRYYVTCFVIWCP